MYFVFNRYIYSFYWGLYNVWNNKYSDENSDEKIQIKIYRYFILSCTYTYNHSTCRFTTTISVGLFADAAAMAIFVWVRSACNACFSFPRVVFWRMHERFMDLWKWCWRIDISGFDWNPFVFFPSGSPVCSTTNASIHTRFDPAANMDGYETGLELSQVSNLKSVMCNK